MKALSTSILQLLIPHHIYSYADISALECVGPCIAYDIRNATMIIQLNIKKKQQMLLHCEAFMYCSKTDIFYVLQLRG